MSKIQGLRVLVKQFLSAAADEIVEAVEKMIAGYEEEMFQSKREITRQRKMLDALVQPETSFNRIPEEAQLKLSVWEEDFLTEQQQERNSSPRQKNPESLQTERSHKEPLSSSQDRRPEDDTIHDTLTQCVKNEPEIYKEEEEPLPVTSAEQMPTEADEEVPSPGLSEAQIDNDKEPLSSSQDRRSEDNTMHDTFTPLCVTEEEEPLPVTSAKQMPIEADEEVPSSGLSEAEIDNDKDWRLSDATQDTDSDRSEELSDSGQHCILTAKTPRMKKKKKSCIICKVCGKSFRNQISLVNHLEIHPKDVCGMCGMHSNTEEDFELHLRTHKNLKFVCNVCGKCFDGSGSLENHMRTHTGEKPFSCSVCGKSFSIHQNMTRHLRIHTGEKPYSCSTCGKCYSDYTSLKRHKCLQNKTLAVDDGNGNAELKNSTAEVTNKPLKQPLRSVCKVCGKDFPSMASLVNHAKTHTGDLCGFCGTRFESEHSLKLHLQTHKNRTKVCEICGEQSSSLLKHMRTHTGEKPFSCSVCGKSFSIHQNMTRHLRIHTGEKPYSCSTCGKCYRDYTTLKRHKCLQDKTLAVDDGNGNAEVKNSSAEVTNKQVKQPLRSACKVCGKDFPSMASLVNHAKTHTGDLCGVCGTRFESEHSLKLHLQTHKNRIKVCEICGEQSSDLLKHMRTHTGEKPFSCSVCGKSFSIHPNMTRHLRIHTGEKPYSCSTCGKCYRDYTTLKHHKCLQDKTLVVDDENGNAEVKNSSAEVTNKQVKQPLRSACKACGKDFPSMASLVNHAKTHTEELCGVCGTRFDSEESLKLHLKTHKSSRKVCIICGKCFANNTHLKNHTRSHTGMKPFSCSVCGKSFSTRQHLQKHLRVHSGEKPYSCNTCNKSYSDCSYFKRHKCCLQGNTLAVTTQAVEDGDDNAEGE